ncbi:DNA polymerase epsilon, subunit B [Coccomyxa subellipsoidea C-169]|uniref:DNA polymerase epsilon subunit n=1 Tax=Coccomyxa subellipsoidea (strain C-169) TaxID=574566 RepID=I0YZ76_COCSC|nr:DNA polymerase epsilon, subunit B [Coccomyxa subellipsoidea C-169]EIE23695.1 DNA polymerase epsilon, subunit B [Coccomyxa subellipsoidea C-169]|eukprot:XP_005648239.1 DNA polymerase epsilon, subunit B [Coccomyxa subellipsoidea C-169]
MASIKRAVQSAFLDAGLTLEKEALNAFVTFVEDNNGGEDLVYQLLDACTKACASSTKLTAAQAQTVIGSLCGSGEKTDPVQVISAFDTPKLRYDPIRKVFYQIQGRPTLHGSSEEKVQMYLDRMYLLLQRLKRNRNFSRPAFAGIKADSRDFVELTELKALLGCVGQVKFVMGCISQLTDGRYFLEDMSDSLPIDLSDAQTTSGFFTENCIVVAEGVLQHSGVFKVRALGFPPVELRSESRLAAKNLDFFGGSTPSEDEQLAAAAALAEDEADRIVVLSDLWLDKPATLDRLRVVLEGFEGLERVPSMFVLLGNFQSFSCNAASTDYAALKDNFGALAGTLASFPRIRAESRLVFVPGLGDAGPGAILPRPPLPESLIGALREQLPTALFTSNPCRIRHFNQACPNNPLLSLLCHSTTTNLSTEIVVFRDNLQNRMRKLCLLAPNDEGTGAEASSDAAFEHLCATLLQQSHLCPVPLEAQPVYWSYDHALSLYPLPDALILADPAPCASFAFPPLPPDQRGAACVCLNPGSFANGTFAAYCPATREVELCDVPEEED